MRCKICNQENNFVDCHIFPRAVHADIYQGVSKKISIDDHPRKFQTGIYDKQLACGHCEKKFNYYDNYFVKFFRKSYLIDQTDSEMNGKIIFHLYKNVNCNLLYGFAIFVLLRASLTTQDFYSEVDLGNKYNKQLCDALLNNNLSSDNSIEVFMCTYGVKTRIQTPPIRTRYGQARQPPNIYILSLPGGIEFYYKVDQLPWKIDSRVLINKKRDKLITPIVEANNAIKQIHKADITGM